MQNPKNIYGFYPLEQTRLFAKKPNKKNHLCTKNILLTFYSRVRACHCQSSHPLCCSHFDVNFKSLPIHFVISLYFRKSNLNKKQKNRTYFASAIYTHLRFENGVDSKSDCRNEYGIGDQCWIYGLLLSARSHCTNNCIANGKFMSHKRITL